MVSMDSHGLAFVVHKHRATQLHYDFRLEIGGVMPSWSIPKGPTLDNTVKRLAMPTDDHDLEYRKFEGGNPERDPDGRAVMIWDEGTYVPEIEIAKGKRMLVEAPSERDEVAGRSLHEGSLKFTLYGKKLQGSFALIRTRGIRGKESWLMIKHRDEFCRSGYNANDYDFSAVSGLSLVEIASRGGAGAPHEDRPPTS